MQNTFFYLYNCIVVNNHIQLHGTQKSPPFRSQHKGILQPAVYTRFIRNVILIKDPFHNPHCISLTLALGIIKKNNEIISKAFRHQPEYIHAAVFLRQKTKRPVNTYKIELPAFKSLLKSDI